MHAALAFLNGAGARKGASGPRDSAFFKVLNLLCTSHRTIPLRVRPDPRISPAARRLPGPRPGR